MSKVQGQREGFETAAKRHLDYLLTNPYVKDQTKELAVRACYGLLLALKEDKSPRAVIRSLEVENVQDQVQGAFHLFSEALKDFESKSVVKTK